MFPLPGVPFWNSGFLSHSHICFAWQSLKPLFPRADWDRSGDVVQIVVIPSTRLMTFKRIGGRRQAVAVWPGLLLWMDNIAHHPGMSPPPHEYININKRYGFNHGFISWRETRGPSLPGPVHGRFPPAAFPPSRGPWDANRGERRDAMAPKKRPAASPAGAAAKQTKEARAGLGSAVWRVWGEAARGKPKLGFHGNMGTMGPWGPWGPWGIHGESMANLGERKSNGHVWEKVNVCNVNVVSRRRLGQCRVPPPWSRVAETLSSSPCFPE